MDPLFTIDGLRIIASPRAAGPWDPGMLHGGGPAGIIAHLAETADPAGAAGMAVTRLSIDLMRPVPVGVLDWRVTPIREGRKIRLLGITLEAQGVEVVRAQVLKVKPSDAPLPEAGLPGPLDLAAPEAATPVDTAKVGRGQFLANLSLRAARGGFGVPGPAAIWYRLDRPFFDLAPTTGLMRAAIAADFCNGTSSSLDFRRWTYINADLTIHVARPPVGDWILLDAETLLGSGGNGLAHGRLGDVQGWFGRAIQSLVIERR